MKMFRAENCKLFSGRNSITDIRVLKRLWDYVYYQSLFVFSIILNLEFHILVKLMFRGQSHIDFCNDGNNMIPRPSLYTSFPDFRQNR